MPPEEVRATATGNMHKNLVTLGFMVFEICEQTDKQTNKLITWLFVYYSYFLKIFFYLVKFVISLLPDFW